MHSTAQGMHQTAANLMNNPYTAAAGEAMEAQATAMEKPGSTTKPSKPERKSSIYK